MKERLLKFGKNANGRVYTKDSYDWSKINDLSKNHLFLGELRDKDDVDSNLSNTLLSKVSHEIGDISIYDDGVYGEVKVLDTKNGKILRELLDNGIDLRISHRSTGTVENGVVVVGKFYGFDFVTPSFDVKIVSRRKKLDKILKRINL